MKSSSVGSPRVSIRRAAYVSCIYVTSVLFLAACQQGERAETRSESGGELEWARTALERNPHIEVLAVDPDAKVFTVRDTQSGDVRAVPLNELAAAPLAQLVAGRSTQSQPQASAATATAESTSPEAQPGDTSSPTELPATPDTSESSAAAPEPAATQREGADSDYTIERSDGQVRVTGPGVSIVSADAASSAGTQPAGNNAVEPIICEGRRMMHLDNREMYVDGDAIVVRGGCEMFITNSRIAASGTAVVVQNGTVHVSNSHVEGADGSLDADGSSKLFVRGSTFRGVPRRAEGAVVQDQGGNRWR